MGALVGTLAGIHLHLPIVLHLIVAMLFAIIGGALWGGIPGLLKAKAGANEVIVTIMLNSIALLFLGWTLKKEFMKGDGTAGKSMYVQDTAAYPHLLGNNYRLDLSFIIAILAFLRGGYWNAPPSDSNCVPRARTPTLLVPPVFLFRALFS